jgi:hypothetical protein
MITVNNEFEIFLFLLSDVLVWYYSMHDEYYKTLWHCRHVNKDEEYLKERGM